MLLPVSNVSRAPELCVEKSQTLSVTLLWERDVQPVLFRAADSYSIDIV